MSSSSGSLTELEDDDNATTPPNSVVVPADVGDTPGVRVRRCTTREAAKKRVDNATYAHILARASQTQLVCLYNKLIPRLLMTNNIKLQLTNLELWWKMRSGTLNVDTRFNIFHCQYLRSLHDVGQLANQYATHVLEPHYEYRVVPSKDMHRFPLFRLNQPIPTNPPEGLDLAAVTETFSYPYPTFGTLQLHVKPQFVICSIAQHLENFPFDNYVQDHPGLNRDELEVILHDIQAIYSDWKEMPSNPDNDASDIDDKHDDDDDFSDNDDDDSDDGTGTVHTNMTKNQRLGKRERERSFNGDGRDDENPRPLRRSRRGTSKRDVLDGQTLLDQEERPDSHKSKLAYVQDWVSKLAAENIAAEEVCLRNSCNWLIDSLMLGGPGSTLSTNASPKN
ncbi:hypothetical protein H0H93_004129 [Arthromyces matolae]|nr:hypothetical protein H0H93_004129 [Arthromyces matolae]